MASTWCRPSFLSRAGTAFSWLRQKQPGRGWEGMVVSCRGIKKATGCKPKAWVKRKIRLPAPAPLGGQTHVNNASNEEGVTKLLLDISSRHVSAHVEHNSGARVVEASTKEFCISKHLYKTCDVAAAYNIGRVIAKRCKETGLYRVTWEHKQDRKHSKVKAFIKALSESGLRLNEPKTRTSLPTPGTMPA